MADVTQVLVNRGYVISFTHIPTKKCVSFKGFLTAFSDNYISDWQSETVYGRMDPIDVFRGTRRNISLSWVVPAYDEVEAQENLSNVGMLNKMLYPTYAAPTNYQQASGPSVIEQPPLLRLRFVNWAKSMNSTIAETTKGSSYRPGLACNSGGLLGHLGGMSFAPNIETGFFDLGGELFPKEIGLTGEFTVLHEHLMGWYASDGGHSFGKNTGRNFPYGKSPPDKTAKKETASTKTARNKISKAKDLKVTGKQNK
jgi:hypothetical protein